jgi:hypothetical protein
MNGPFDVQSVQSRVLRSDEHLLPRESALPHRSPSLLLVAVQLSGICPVAVCMCRSVGLSSGCSGRITDMTESDGDSLVDLIYGTLPIAEGPRAECDARNGAA